MSETAETLSAIAYGDAPVFETLTGVSLDTLEPSGLNLKTYMMVRIAGLVAMDAPPVSYAINAEDAIDVLDLEDFQAILVVLAPVVGSARIAAAAANILDVFFEEVGDEEIIMESDDEPTEDVVVFLDEISSDHGSQEAENEESEGEERQLETV